MDEGLGQVCGGLGDHDDWLIAGCGTRSTIVSHEAPGSTTHVLSNGKATLQYESYNCLQKLLSVT